MDGHAKLVVGAIVPCVALIWAVLKSRRGTRTELEESEEPEKSGAGGTRPAKRVLPLVYPTGTEWSVGWGELAQNPYDEETNPKGCINLGMAENRVSRCRSEGRLQ